MAIPDYESVFFPVLRSAADGINHSIAEIRDRIAAELGLTSDELSEKLSNGTRVFANRVACSATYLTRAGALERVEAGSVPLTSRGRELLAAMLRGCRCGCSHHRPAWMKDVACHQA